MFTQIAEQITAALAAIPFDILVWFAWGSCLAIFVLVFILTLAVPRIRNLSKRPLLCLANAYAAVTLALFLTETGFENAVIMTALFWLAAYLLYGLLCLISANRKKSQPSCTVPQISPVPTSTGAPARRTQVDVPAAKSTVRLEHAVSITDRLLQKNLGKSDRQELEKLKNTLAVLQIKGTLTPTESEILNENFNTLLKLMAKYDV